MKDTLYRDVYTAPSGRADVTEGIFTFLPVKHDDLTFTVSEKTRGDPNGSPVLKDESPPQYLSSPSHTKTKQGNT